ncbi:MAG: PTS glucose transporter subunit IIA [Mycoplasmataceae bacterium]|nr:PTS glucose transporter subunit IIA [Mycoplasmataceae bacterium]
MKKEIIILSPCDGKVKNLNKVNDEIFAKEMVGKGFAITPSNKTTIMFSPVIKGKVKMAFEGGHAYGISVKKLDLLIHIGIETVNLKGEGFNQKSFLGDKLKNDSILTEVDLKKIKSKAVSTDTMVLVTNESIGNYTIERIAGSTVKAGEPLFKLI